MGYIVRNGEVKKASSIKLSAIKRKKALKTTVRQSAIKDRIYARKKDLQVINALSNICEKHRPLGR